MFFLVLLIPVFVMVFAIAMEHLERRLTRTTMSEQDVEEFLDKAQPDEVNTFIREGWTRALSRFRLRRHKLRPSWRARLFAARHGAGPATRVGATRAARNTTPLGGRSTTGRPTTGAVPVARTGVATATPVRSGQAARAAERAPHPGKSDN